LTNYDSFLTSFLTSTLHTKNKQLLNRAKKIMHFLLNNKKYQSYLAEIAKYLNEPKQTVSYVLNKMIRANIIVYNPQIQYPKMFLLNEDVRKSLNEILGGVTNSHFSHSDALKLRNEKSKKVYRAHRHLTILKHNLTSQRFQYLLKRGLKRGKVTHNNSRIIFRHIFDNYDFTIVFTRKKLLIYSPVIFGELQEYSQLRSQISLKVGEFISFLKKEYLIELEYLDEKHFADKYEIGCQDSFNEYVAQELKKAGYEKIDYPDWSMDASPGDPEIDLIQGWKNNSNRPGIGPELYNDLLYYPQEAREQFDNLKQGLTGFFETNIEHSSLLTTKVNSIIEVQREHTKQLKEVTNNLGQITNVLSNLVNISNTVNQNMQSIPVNIATIDDIESLRADIQHMKTTEESNPILELLEKRGMLSHSEIAKILGIKKSAVTYHMQKLKGQGLIDIEKVKTGMRGRPQNYYRLKGD